VTIFPVERIRSQFLTLSAPSVFLDNPLNSSAPAVIEAVSGAMVGAASNTGGNFQASLDDDAIYARAHEAMAELLGFLQAAKSSSTVRWLPFIRDTWRIEPEDLRPLL